MAAFNKDKSSRLFTVKEAAELLEMTSGGLRGAILRGKLRAHKNDNGKHVIKSHNLAVFHLYGDNSAFPEDTMEPKSIAAFNSYLDTMTSA